MVNCPECGAPSFVLATRGVERQRQCKADSSHRWRTHEVIAGDVGDKRRGSKAAPLGPTQRVVMRALSGAAATVHELMADLPKSSRTAIMDAVRGLRARGLVYVAGYAPKPPGRGGRRPPRYALGGQPDAPEPSVPKVEKDRAYRERRKLRATPWQGL